MRILFATRSEKTHFLSMVPLAWALRTAGHEVRVACQPELVDTVTSSGLTCVPVGSDHDFWRLLRLFPDRRETARAGQSVPFDVVDMAPEDITWEYLRDGYANLVPWWFRMVNDPIRDELVEYCRRWRPDAVLWEPGTYAASVAAEAVGAVHARVTCGADLYGWVRRTYLEFMAEQPEAERVDPLADWLRRSAARHGVAFDERLTHGHFTIEQLPPPLRIDGGLEYLGLRYVPHNGRSVVDPWLWAPPERPRVCLTLGTTEAERFGDHALSVRSLVHRLAELDAEIVATVAETEQEALGPLPENVRVEGFVPLQALLPSCAAIVHHGGWGTVNSAVAAGVPQLLIPNDLDAPFLSRRVEEAGAGTWIAPPEATGERVRDAVDALLSDGRYQRGALRLREEALTQPSPNAFVATLEEAVRRHSAAPVGN
ncbi:activator-dependent family glycosyltransferase [Nocardiopsis sp. NPDC006938]|uniref:activator-dependent family glycosyltransferase n=1 Tax=Nocardiopsis sp. NPDC006938 TaxID=3364337 RepID=UPI003697CCCA